MIFRATESQAKFIYDNYKGISSKDLTELFNKEFNMNITTEKIKSFKSRNQLKSGLDGRFKKGQKSFNKGLKQTDFMSKEAIEKTKKTRFKRGNRPCSTKEIGSEYIDKDGYLYIKTKNTGPRFGKKGMWQQYHNLVWELYHGVIPKESVVIFLDKDKTNFDINNLKLISRSELLILNKNKMLTEHSEVNESVVMLAKLISARYKVKQRF